MYGHNQNSAAREFDLITLFVPVQMTAGAFSVQSYQYAGGCLSQTCSLFLLANILRNIPNYIWPICSAVTNIGCILIVRLWNSQMLASKVKNKAQTKEFVYFSYLISFWSFSLVYSRASCHLMLRLLSLSFTLCR